jgi:hypothetical protein
MKIGCTCFVLETSERTAKMAFSTVTEVGPKRLKWLQMVAMY